MKVAQAKQVEDTAKHLADLTVAETVTDMDQLVRFSLVDEQIAKYGKTRLTGLSAEEKIAKLLD